MSLWYLGTHETVFQPVQAGLAMAEIAQINILEPIVKLPQDQGHVVVAGGRSRQMGGLLRSWDQAGHIAWPGPAGRVRHLTLSHRLY